LGVTDHGDRMIYTPDVSAAIRSVKMPVEMTIDIVDFGDYLGIRFYESEWAHISESERIKMAAYFELIRRMLKNAGISSTLDPIYDKPGVQRVG
jgi:hypothetical protein